MRFTLVATALAGASLDIVVQPIELASVNVRAAELDSLTVEFDAYAWQAPGSVLMVSSGAAMTTGDGRSATACDGPGAISLPVFVTGRKGALSQAEMTNGRLPKVRIRARFQNRPVTTDNPRCLGLCQQDHPMYFERGVIVKRYDRSEGCLRSP